MPDLRGLLYVLLVLAVCLAGLLFGLENAEPVALSLFEFSSPSMPLVIWVLVALLLGLALGYALATGVGLRRRLARRKLEKARAASRQGIEDLRQIAATPDAPEGDASAAAGQRAEDARANA